MAYYDFACQQGHITELKMSMEDYKRMVMDGDKNGLEFINCPECKSIAPEAFAHRIYSRPGHLQMNYRNGQRH